MERPLDDASFAPLGALRVVTPMLTLQWPSASDQAELLDVIERGIHDPSFMPFGNAWTDTPVHALDDGSWMPRSMTSKSSA